MTNNWDEDLISDRTDHNCETCFCVGPQEGEDGVLDPLCPCRRRKFNKDLRELNRLFKEHTSKTGVPCLWDNIPVEDRKKSMGLSCNCPKCSVQCL
jgi:hypothetical protein